MSRLLFFTTLCAIFSIVFSSTCSNPEVTTRSFTTQDATIVSKIAYISEFTIKCGSGEIGSLYAEIDGNVVPVPSVAPDSYQVSWTEEIKTARSGQRQIRILDEEAYTAYRKALRAGEDVSGIQAITTVFVDHPGAFSGPWLKSEFIATVISLGIAYFAIASRSKVVS